MTSTHRLMRPLLLGAAVLALSAAGGCSWFKAKTNYTSSTESRPLEVPPDLDRPVTTASTSMPVSSSLGGTAAPSPTDVTIAGMATEAFPKVGAALQSIDGVTINGRAEALGSYDVTYKGESFLIRVQDSATGSRMVALSPDGRMLVTGPAAQLLAAVKAKL